MNENKNLTELTLDEINDEIDRITNFEFSGGGYGDPDAREADERKLRVLMSLREQKLTTNRTAETMLRESHSKDNTNSVHRIMRNHMTITNNRREKTVFMISFAGTVFFAVIGIAAYFITKSQAVLLDGLFTLTSVFLAAISMWVIKIASSKPTDEYPFGLIQTRPMLELFKSLIILGFLMIALFENITVLFTGGRALPGVFIVVYAAFSVVGSLVVILAMWRVGRGHDTSLINLEIIQWLQDTLISASIGIAFAITTWIHHPVIQRYAPYLDALLVIMFVLIFVPTMIKSLLKSGHELLLGAPTSSIRQHIRHHVLSVCQEYDLGLKGLYTISSGGVLYVDIEVTIQSVNVVEWTAIQAIRTCFSTRISEKFPQAETFVAFFPEHVCDSPSNSINHEDPTIAKL